MKISRGFREHKWVWLWKKYFSVKTKFIITIVCALITLAMYIPIDITQKAYLKEDMLCAHPSIYFLAFGSSTILLTLCYFSYRVIYVVDPFFLKYEVLLNSFVFMPLIIFFAIYVFYPAPFLSFLDLRLSSLVAAIGGFNVNMLFPTLLTFESFERKMLRINEKKISESESQELEIKSKRANPDQPKDEFHYVLQSPILFDSFVDYTVRSWSVENILFYQAVETFEEQFSNPEFDLKEGVQRVVEEFIAEKSPLEVNIESASRHEILTALKSDNITVDIFAPVKHEIYCLMRVDSFEKWRLTPAYISALQTEMEKSNQSLDSSKKTGPLDDFLTGSGAQRLPRTVHPISINPNSF